MNLQKFYQENNIRNIDDVYEKLSVSPFFLNISENDGLYRLIYDENKSDHDNEIVKECANGIILDSNNNIVCYSLNKTEDIDVCDGIRSQPPFGTDEMIVEELVDGTLIRLYYYDNTWRTSTKKKINAENAYWHSKKSFAELFDECASNLDRGLLDRGLCYSFIIKHPENRIVTEYKQKSIIHVGTRNLETLQEIDVNIGIPKPRKCQEFTDINQVIEKTKSLDLAYHTVGYMLRDKNYNRVMIKSLNYLKVRNLKGNVPDMSIRFLQLKKQNKIGEFLQFYPEYITLFRELDTKLVELSKKVYKIYHDSRVNKKKVVFPQYMGEILYKIHGIFLHHRKSDPRFKITVGSVYYIIINELPIRKIKLLVDQAFRTSPEIY